jgi:hypothetical protein
LDCQGLSSNAINMRFFLKILGHKMKKILLAFLILFCTPAFIYADGGKNIGNLYVTGSIKQYTAIAGENLTAGNLVNLYLDTTLKCRKADNTDNAKEAWGYVGENFTSGNTVTIYPLGFGNINADLTGLTIGTEYYLGTSGGVTSTPPTTTNYLIQSVGIAKTTTALITLHERPVEIVGAEGGTAATQDFYGYKALITKNGASPDDAIDIDAVYLSIEGYTDTDIDLTVDCTGTGANGIDTGSLGASTQYYVFGIYNVTNSTMAGLVSASATSPTMPSGYTKKRLIGFALTDGDSDLVAYHQFDERVDFDARLMVATGLTSTSYTTQDLSGILPTGTGLVKEVLFGSITSASNYMFVSDDGTNAKAIWVSYQTYNSIGQQHELQGPYGAAIFAKIDGNNIHYKTDTGGSTTLYIRAYKFSLGN